MERAGAIRCQLGSAYAKDAHHLTPVVVDAHRHLVDRHVQSREMLHGPSPALGLSRVGGGASARRRGAGVSREGGYAAGSHTAAVAIGGLSPFV